MKFKYLIILVLFSLLSCQEEDKMNPNSVIYVEEEHTNELDTWIYENLTKPYNIMVKYKWDDNEVDNASWLIPPTKEKAKMFVEMFNELWIKPYAEEGGIDFVKKYVPKLLVLCGCPAYNGDNTMTLGFAEGGRKVAVFDVNSFGEVNEEGKTEKEILDAKRQSVIESFHTMHHEFAHILHQTKFYPVEFPLITKGEYTANWVDVPWDVANAKGYITSYSMLNPNEDWVEIVAGILTNVLYTNDKKDITVPAKDENGFIKDGEFITQKMSTWDLKLWMWGIGFAGEDIAQNPNAPQGLRIFNQKVEMLTKYYRSNWGIDLYNLQKRIENAVIENVK